jgi:hypothetical protein
MNARLKAVSVILFVLAFLEYRPWRGYSPERHVELATEPIRIADSLLRESSFANPFGAARTGVTAHAAPGLPFLQFLLLKLFSEGAVGWLAVRTLPVLALGLQFSILPWAASLMGLSPWAGVLTAAFGLLNRPGSEWQWEAHLAALFCLLLIASSCRFAAQQNTAWAIANGIVAGIAFLFQPVFVLPYLFLSSIQLIRQGPKTNVLLLFTIPFLICAPWCLRNYRSLGTLGIRDNLGLELYVSFNDCAPYGFQQNLTRLCQGALHPNSSIQEAEAVRTLGESRYNRDRLRTAIRWIYQHPAAAASLVLQRFWFFWFPSSGGLAGYRSQRAGELVLHLLTLASAWGLTLAWKRRLPCTESILVWLLLFPPIYYLVEFDPRYRYPILWMTGLFAAHAFTTLICVWRSKPSPLRVAAHAENRCLKGNMSFWN